MSNLNYCLHGNTSEKLERILSVDFLFQHVRNGYIVGGRLPVLQVLNKRSQVGMLTITIS